MNKSAIKIVISLILVMVFSLCPCFIAGHAASVLGDINADGKINSGDALIVLQFATLEKTPTAEQKKLADINADGSINSTDALEILIYSTSGKSPYIKTTTTTTKTTTTTTKSTTTTTKSTTKPTSSTSYQGTVTADPSLRLRSGPGTSYSVLANVPFGAVVTITATSGNWGKTTYNGKTGWVSLDYISKGTTKPQSGTFTITCYGYGHGVGMSQYGGIYYADSGWKYDRILLHYYYSDKTKLVKDNNMPATVKYGGVSYPLKTYIAGSVFAETGTSCNIEAIKSQMVAIYTFAKYYNFNVSSSTHAYKAFDYKGTKIEQAMNAVLGEYLSYDGKPILAVYCSSMGGKNTNVKDAWLGDDIPYLRGGRVTPEPDSISKRVSTFTAEEIKALVKSTIGVNLTGDPSKWFTDIVHDKSVSDDIGYIKSMKVGGVTVRGEQVRTKLFKFKIRSHCIGIKYNP